ncbi:MAG: RecQ family ATP-dependent DNA helicase [Prevotellaceae bacterium]|nr:RecQ family ATP-dependent DNA helicase [Prevotellaceae bacterium]
MKDYLSILKQYWGYDAFRGVQEEIIRSIGEGKDTLGLMPTGGGKSITFQVPALAQDGLCLVITPLIALMKDQVRNLKSKGIKATAVYAGMSREEVVMAYDNCIYGDYKFLYLSPERINSELFLNKLKHMAITFIAVDEAHCISQWGYDFRPSYLNIGIIRTHLPDKPILALTATATSKVVDDIQEKLHFSAKNVFKMSFERTNLAYVVRRVEDKKRQLLHILSSIEGSAIVYTRYRRHTKEYAEFLNENGFTATEYHAGFSDRLKDEKQEMWCTGKVRVMVATNAFGMGIDKSDVKLVCHMDVPETIENYFQEAGRAGRNGEKAYAVLLYAKSDKGKLTRRLNDAFPSKDYIRDIYEKLCFFFQIAMGDGFGCRFDFSFDKFCWLNKLGPRELTGALQILTKAGYIEYVEAQDYSALVWFRLEKEQLYRLRGNGEIADRVIDSILRSYTGAFADYIMFDEEMIAYRSGISKQTLYDTLVMLSRLGILSYIPSRRTPIIIFKMRRIEKEKLVFPPEIYEERKAHRKKLIDEILYYAEEEEICRSRMLLRYFGEKTDHNCGVCDLCVARKKQNTEEEAVKDGERKILEILSGGSIYITDLLPHFHYNEKRLARCLRNLMGEEKIRYDAGVYSLAK